jgi:hypothetical protein
LDEDQENVIRIADRIAKKKASCRMLRTEIGEKSLVGPFINGNVDREDRHDNRKIAFGRGLCIQRCRLAG